MMSRKDYVLLANWIGTVRVTLPIFESMLSSMTAMLMLDSASFNEDKFMAMARKVRHGALDGAGNVRPT